MENIWLKSYQDGVPAEINADAYASIVEVFEESCQRFRDKPAARNMGVEITYGQLDQLSQQFAAYCQDELKLQQGDRLAIMMPNVLQYLVVLFGGLRAGLTIVNVNPLYTAKELGYQMKDSGAKAIVVLANFANTVQRALPRTKLEHVIVTELADFFPLVKKYLVNFVVKYVKKMVPAYKIPNAVSLNKAISIGQSRTFNKVDLSGSDIAFLQYTGGTTGVAKGAVLTHRNMVANMQQASAWVTDVFKPGEEAIITALPLYHIFSLTANGLVFMKLGAVNILITNPRDIPNFVNELKTQKFSAMTGVNTLFNALLNHKDIIDVDFSHLKITLGGGMAVQSDVAKRWFELTANPISQAYGLTEASPAVTINPLHLKEFNGSIGLPLPSTEVSIRDDNGVEVSTGELGELCVRGPQVMREYWQHPDETAKVFYTEKWLRTGDVARLDDNGFVFLVDRIKDMIVVSGFKVYPNEVEDVISQHPNVIEVGVVGLRDKKGDEVVTAVIVKDGEVSTKELKELCRKNLTAYKVPKRFEFVDELPKTNVGKILRRGLREQFAD